MICANGIAKLPNFSLHSLSPSLKIGAIPNPNIEIPAFAEAASRRQAKHIPMPLHA
jgi:hypothetical protein